MKLARIFPMVALALVLAACGGAAALRSSESTGAPAQLAPQAPAGGAAPALEGSDASSPGSANQPPTDQQGITRLVIKSADISLQVETVRDAEVAVRAKVNELGGYIVRVETNGTDQSLTSHITFRVPAERFDDALTGLQGLAQKVLSRTVSGDDVTEEFVDLESRLRNLEATRDRLQAFLDKAATVEEALKVNNSLSQIQGEIEQLKGRSQFLKQSAALSTITVYLTPVPITPLVAEELVAAGQGGARGVEWADRLRPGAGGAGDRDADLASGVAAADPAGALGLAQAALQPQAA